jgi:hypothetical protein
MAIYRVNVDDELKKAAAGKSKLPKHILESVIYDAVRDYPTIQALIGDAFGITEG